MYWLLTENYVLNANILVFMLIHTELFSNVSGLGLMPSWPRQHPWAVCLSHPVGARHCGGFAAMDRQQPIAAAAVALRTAARRAAAECGQCHVVSWRTKLNANHPCSASVDFSFGFAFRSDSVGAGATVPTQMSGPKQKSVTLPHNISYYCKINKNQCIRSDNANRRLEIQTKMFLVLGALL